ncbi:hypothetical protein JCM10450v2_000820 [Rhodotorula kratochvilovae]
MAERPPAAPSRPLAISGRPPSPAPLSSSYGSPSSPYPSWQAPRTIYSVSPPGRVGAPTHGGATMATSLRGAGTYDEFGRRLSSSSWYSMPVGAGSPPQHFQQAPSRQVQQQRPTLPPIQTSAHGVPAGTRPSASSSSSSTAGRRRSLAGVQLPPIPSSSAPRRLSNASHTPAPPPSIGRRVSEDLPLSPPPPDDRDRDRAPIRRPKTPPDCCAVCGALSTPEWRKGPAGNRSLCNGCGLLAAKRAKEREVMREPAPVSLEEIEAELEAIGNERFKPNGRYQLPRGTKQRILDTQARTRAATIGLPPQQQPQQKRPRSRSTKLAGGEKAAVGALVELRRASVSSSTPAFYQSAMAPRSPPASTRGRRSGSLAGEGSYFPSNVGTSGGTGLPPSSSYMLPPGGVGPSSTFSFGRPPSPVSAALANCTRPASSSARRLSTSVGPGLVSPVPLRPSATPAPFARPASPARSVSALAASTNRMSIAHLNAPSPRPPSPQRWEAPPTPVSRLEHATSALRRRSSSIVGVLPPPPPTVPRVQTPSLTRRTTS